jgi:hypothetical protein
VCAVEMHIISVSKMKANIAAVSLAIIVHLVIEMISRELEQIRKGLLKLANSSVNSVRNIQVLTVGGDAVRGSE